jgi:hypothetical protein
MSLKVVDVYNAIFNHHIMVAVGIKVVTNTEIFRLANVVLG